MLELFRDEKFLIFLEMCFAKDFWDRGNFGNFRFPDTGVALLPRAGGRFLILDLF